MTGPGLHKVFEDHHPNGPLLTTAPRFRVEGGGPEASAAPGAAAAALTCTWRCSCLARCSEMRPQCLRDAMSCTGIAGPSSQLKHCNRIHRNPRGRAFAPLPHHGSGIGGRRRGRGQRALLGRGVAPFEDHFLKCGCSKCHTNKRLRGMRGFTAVLTSARLPRLPFPEERPRGEGSCVGAATRQRAAHGYSVQGPRPHRAHPEEQAGRGAEKPHPRPSRCSGEAACNPAHRQAAGLGSAACARGLLVYRGGRLGGGPPADGAPAPWDARMTRTVCAVCAPCTPMPAAAPGLDRDLGRGRGRHTGRSGRVLPPAGPCVPPTTAPARGTDPDRSWCRSRWPAPAQDGLPGPG